MTRDKREKEDSSTGEDEEDSRDKRQDGAMRSNVPDVVEDKADEHEEEADERERSGWADHLWGEEESCCLTPEHMTK